VDNHIIARYPIDGSGNSVFVASLQRVNDSKNFSGVATSRCRVGKDGADGLLGVNNEDRSNGECDSLLIDIGSILVVQHVVLERDLSLLVTNNGELQIAAADLVDILDPFAVAVNGVRGQTDQLDSSSCKFRLEFGECSEFRCADWGEIFGMREQHNPLVTDEFMEVDGPLSGLSVKVWRNRAEAQTTFRLVSKASARYGSTYGSTRSPVEPILLMVETVLLIGKLRCQFSAES
jgi:hypothetical protein